MAVDAVVGIPGSGKSLWGVTDGLRRWENGYRKARDKHHQLLKLNGKLSDQDVRNMPPLDSYQGLAANFDFDLVAVARWLRYRHDYPWKECVVLASTIQTVKSIQDLLDLWNTIVIFDEAQLWFSARDYAYFPTEVLSFWTQHRKGGIDVILLTQKYEMVDSNIRGVVANVYRARPVPWTLKLTRLLLGKMKLIKHAERPLFRYTNILDETEGTQKSAKVKGMGDAINRNSTIVLDPLVAACYATTGHFYSPSAELHDAVDSQKSKIRRNMNLNYDLSRFRKNRAGWQPMEPGLSIPELAEAYLLDLDIPAAIALLQESNFDTVVPVERFRASPPTQEGRGAALVEGATVSVETPKENPPAGTEGVRGAPAQYSGARKWGVHRGT